MRRILFLLLLCFTLAPAFAQMSDDAVVKYVKEGVQQGKSQSQLSKELLAKGVTKEQVERLRAQYENQQRNQAHNQSTTVLDVQRGEIETRDVQETNMAGVKEVEESGIRVYGRDIFRTANLTFEPSLNVATPQKYRLGPGDEVIIQVWGASESNIAQKITPDGYITIPSVGPVSLNGLTVEAARERICSKLSKIYAGMQNSDVDFSTNVQVSVGQIRTIQVNILGEVARPGTYAISSFSTVFHALYKAGGIGSLGSLRNIKVVRGGKTIAQVDVYDYLMRGKSSDDIRLQEGDVVLVAPYEMLVDIEGNVKRPMYYEMRSDETLSTLLKYTGGFTSDAYSGSLTIERNSGIEKTVCTVDKKDFGSFKLQDGDKVDVGAILSRYNNRVQIKGAVYRPGFYQLSNDISTVRQLVRRADGLLEEAFTNRAVLHREHEDKTLEVISVDLSGILNGKTADIALQKNDILFIPSIHDLKDQGELTIMGEVFSPGRFPYAENTKLEDLIIQAGGLRESASTVRVDVSRRIIDPTSTKKQKEISENFTFSVRDGFVIEGEPGFILKPNDQVHVRRSPGYSPQINVAINGEVQFEGTYSLSERNERISDLIAKAGGISEYAYLKGARLVRTMTLDEERQTFDLISAIVQNNANDGDSILIGKRFVQQRYNVAIDLEKALNSPHSDYDLALREGDSIYVPQYNNIIQILGSVNMPNTVTYFPGQKLDYYIGEAGGYTQGAKKNRVFIIYPNGHIARLKDGTSSDNIIPGSKIIVPHKNKSNWNIGYTLSTITASVSMLAVIATMVNALK